MADLNKIISDASSLHKKIKKDLRQLAAVYETLTKDVNRTFREELRYQNGKIEGLEDFYSLLLASKKNSKNAVYALRLVEEAKDLSGFNVSEEAIEKAFKKVELEKEEEKLLEEALL